MVGEFLTVHLRDTKPFFCVLNFLVRKAYHVLRVTLEKVVYPAI
jgi:hypothetical protein